MKKQLTVIKAESGQPVDIEIQPGTTAGEILTHIGLGKGYVLSGGRGQEPFGNDENVYEQVADGSKLYASTPVEVGGWFQDFLDSFDCDKDKQQAPAPGGGLSRAIIKASSKLVRRDTRPYWQQRGWVKRNAYRIDGYFRTRFGSWKGKATISPSKRIELFIHKPPAKLRKHPHWECFMSRAKNWYFVHTHGIKDLSSGIMQVERVLTEAYTNEKPSTKSRSSRHSNSISSSRSKPSRRKFTLPTLPEPPKLGSGWSTTDVRTFTPVELPKPVSFGLETKDENRFILPGFRRGSGVSSGVDKTSYPFKG